MPFWQAFLTNPTAKEQYLLKLKTISLIRQFFTNRGLLEVDPPYLNKALIPESYLDVFRTEERRVGLDGVQRRDLYLMTSPEAFQKKLMVAGIGSNFALIKSFRNGEPLSGKHLSEFNMLEWYEKGSNYLNVMETTQDLLVFLIESIHGKGNSTINYQGQTIDFTAPWIRLSINDAFKQYVSMDLEETWDQNTSEFSVKLLKDVIRKHDFPININTEATWEQLYNQLLSIYIEPNLPLDKPVILYDYPYELSPIAKPKNGVAVQGNVWAERFEVMAGGLELCDTYSENTDANIQKASFNTEIAKIKAKTDKQPYEYDWDFVNAMAHGLPESSGNAMGIDRVVMLLGDYKEIQEL